MLDRLYPEDRDAVVRAALWTLAWTAVAVVVWLFVGAAPAPLDRMFRPAGQLVFLAPAGAFVWTLLRYAMATRESNP